MTVILIMAMIAWPSYTTHITLATCKKNMWSARKQLAAGSYRVNALLAQVGEVSNALARVCRRMQQESCRDVHALVACHCTRRAPVAC